MSANLLRNSVLATYGLAAQGLARLGYTVLVGREAGAGTLGSVSTVLAISVFASLLWPMASGTALSLFLADAGHRAREVLRAYRPHAYGGSLAVSVLASVAVMLVGLTGWWIPGCLGATLFYCVYVVHRGAQLGLGNYGRIAVADSVGAVVLLAVALAMRGATDPATILLPIVIAYAVSAALLWPNASIGAPGATGSPGAPGDIGAIGDAQQKRVARPSVEFLWTNSVGQVSTGGLLHLTMLGAQLSASAEAVGLFAAAFSLATPASMVGQSLHQVLIPTLTAQGSAAGSARVDRLLVRAGAGLLAIFAVGIVVAPVVLTLMYGSAYEPAAGYMRAMLAAVAVFSVSLLPAATLVAARRTREYMVATVAGLLLGSVTIFTLGAFIAVWGAVIGYAAGVTVTMVLMLGLYLRPGPAAGHAR